MGLWSSHSGAYTLVEQVNDYRNPWRPWFGRQLIWSSPVWPLNCAIEGVTKNLIVSHADPWISRYIRLPLALVGHVRFLQMATYDFPQQTHGRICHKYGQTNAQRQYQFIKRGRCECRLRIRMNCRDLEQHGCWYDICNIRLAVKFG